MSTEPLVSIVGRPNVGKSSLFNRIVGRRAAVVDDMPGVTRDRHYATAVWNGLQFRIVDTGGLVPTSDTPIEREIHKQVDMALAESDFIIFLVEAGTGPTDLDEMIAKHLRRVPREKLILAVNKSESYARQLTAYEYAGLGMGDPMAISAIHGQGVADMLDTVVATIADSHEDPGETPADEAIRVAVVGRPNAGKSSLVNKLLGQERMIVDDIAGTTRDAVDSSFVHHGIPFVIIDTAGLRKKARVKENVEYYSNLRALESIKRSTVCVVLFDVTQGIGEQDLKIVSRVQELHKGLVLCFNKWDLAEKDSKTFDQMVAEIRNRYLELRHAPMMAISAKTGQRVVRILDKATDVRNAMRARVSRSGLEKNLFEWSRKNPHPNMGTRSIRILGAKQMEAEYPLFHIFATNSSKVQTSYARFLTNKLYDTYGFEGCPLKLEFKPAGRPKA